MHLFRLLLAVLVAPVGSIAATRDYLKQPEAWFATEEARTVAANIISYQSEYGGWPKNMDLTAAPFAGRSADLVGEFRPIFDNGATTDEIRYLARMFRATGEPRYLHAVENGIDFILIAQYPTGGWPQSYPPDTTYHRHITFNDNAMVRLMSLLREIVDSGSFAFLDTERGRAAESAFQRGIECIIKCQVEVDGKLTAWCAQHDEIGYAPRPARRFELVSLSGGESVGIVRLLMSLDRPTPAVIGAIETAIAWFDAARIDGWRVTENRDENGNGKNFVAVQDSAAKPLWARFYDIGTNEPLWSDMDSIPRLGMANAGWARHGYAWTGYWPQVLLEKEYPAWKAAVAKTGAGLAVPPWQPRLRIALAGDSTVKDAGGWAFGFKKTLGVDVLCENFAQGAGGAKEFRDSANWSRLLASRPDYVLIAFGHEEMRGQDTKQGTDFLEAYKETLVRFVGEARQVGVKPVILTPLARRHFGDDGKLRGELAPYPEAARRVAAEERIPLLDLYARSSELVEKLGPAGVERFDSTIPQKRPAGPAAATAGEASSPKPVSTDPSVEAPLAAPRRDPIHLTAKGSIDFGRIVAAEFARELPEIRRFLRKGALP